MCIQTTQRGFFGEPADEIAGLGAIGAPLIRWYKPTDVMILFYEICRNSDYAEF